MHVVIVGCGRVGSSLALSLVGEGWDVAVVDDRAESFYLLGEDFAGQFVEGKALDWDVLRAAGIDHADAVVTATDGDNTNIVVAQVAMKKFGVKCVIARVYDPLRAELFAQTGIRTICPTKDARVLLLDAVHSCEIAAGA
jgi:trk system potassium uptake protein TrkA